MQLIAASGGLHNQFASVSNIWDGWFVVVDAEVGGWRSRSPVDMLATQPVGGFRRGSPLENRAKPQRLGDESMGNLAEEIRLW